MAAVSYYSNLATLEAAKFNGLSCTEAVLNAANKAAYNEINAVLDRLWSVPFDCYKDSGTPPGIIEDISDILTMWLYKRYTTGHSTSTKGPLLDEVKQARELLARIGKGEVNIPGVTRSDLSALSSSTQGEHPVFASIDELNMAQDSDQLDRLTDERD